MALLNGCTAMQEDFQPQMADQAKAEAERVGHSGPLYDHYERCLNRYWKQALDAGRDASEAYDAGVQRCHYELDLLCEYYGVATCPQDAAASNRLLFRLMRENYASQLEF